MSRETVASVFDKTISDGNTFIRSKHRYLCERVLSTITRNLVKTKRIRLDTYSTYDSYWGFDFESFVNRVGHGIESLDNISLRADNSFGKPGYPGDVRILYQPSRILRRYGSNMLERYREMLGEEYELLVIDREKPPKKLMSFFDSRIGIEKNGRKLMIEEEITGVTRKIMLHGQTSLPVFHRRIRA